MGIAVDTQRELIRQLDEVRNWLATISAQLTILGADPDRPEAGPMFGPDSAHNAMMEVLLSYALPSSPSYTLNYAVGSVLPVLLASNDSANLLRINVVNDDPAVMCWLQPSQDVSPANGRVLIAGAAVAYVLPQGSQLWCISAAPGVATIAVRVETGWNIRSILQGRVG